MSLSKINGEKIRQLYESGVPMTALARRYKVRKTSIREALLRVGGHVHTGSFYIFTDDQCSVLRREYETNASPGNPLRGISMNEMGKKYRVNGQTIGRALLRAGAILKSRNEARRFHSSERFQRIWKRYHLSEIKYWATWDNQRGLCWWCSRPLPRKSSCVVDHRGKVVRGLCCPDNRCNMICGHLEKGWKIPYTEIQKLFRRQHE